MIAATNLLAAFDRVTEHSSPKIIGRVNDQYLKAAKLKGEFVFHDHADEDELFYVVRGRMQMAFEDTWAHFCIHHFNQDGLVRERPRITKWLDG